LDSADRIRGEKLVFSGFIFGWNETSGRGIRRVSLYIDRFWGIVDGANKFWFTGLALGDVFG
jgi:hypothetical protein